MPEPLSPTDPTVLGKYLLLGRLGAGGMGTVYLGQAPDGERVAVKCVRPEFAAEPEFRGRFQQEIERARQVPAFCTAEVLDADVRGDRPYLVTEYVDGPGLGEAVRADGPLRRGNLHALALGVAGALTAIHGAGVVHRDLKPGNVLLGLGSPKVIDFGIARAFEPTTRHTRTGMMVGTIDYMAPERFDDVIDAGPAADVFAWGAVIAYAANGRSPFGAGSPTATAARILTAQPVLGALTGALRDLVARSLSKEPADRPTAAQLVQALLTTPGNARVSASDDDREGAARVLQQAVHDGHLGLDEFDVRLQQAFGARTHATLGEAVADLPGHAPARHAEPPVHDREAFPLAARQERRPAERQEERPAERQERKRAARQDKKPEITYGPIERFLRATVRGVGRAAVFCVPAAGMGTAVYLVAPEVAVLGVGAGLVGMTVRTVVRAERRRYNKPDGSTGTRR